VALFAAFGARAALALPASLRELEARPDWLFGPAECPAELVSARPQPFRDLAEGCAADPRAFLARCRAGSGAECYALGEFVQESGDERAEEYADALFLRACKLGIDSGCTNVAARLSSRVAREIVPSASEDRCAARTFDKVCQRGDPWACTLLGLHLAIGRGVAQDLERALAVLPGGCRLGEREEACTRARELMRAIERQRSTDPRRP
jgi:TPR repeat protein